MVVTGVMVLLSTHMQRALIVGSLLLLMALRWEAYFLDVPRFRGAPIEIREWMVVVASVILVAHALILSLILLGSFASFRAMSVRWLRLARVALAGALLACVMHIALPLVIGNGPFDPSSTPVKVMRALCFAPAVLRALGLFAFLTGARGGFAQWSRAPVLVCAVIDVVISGERWLATPFYVTPLIHPASVYPLATIPAAICALALLWIGARGVR